MLVISVGPLLYGFSGGGGALVLPDLEHFCLYLILGLLETLVVLLALAIAGCPL